MFLFFSPGDGVTTETQTTLEETSTSATPVVEPIVEQIQITKTASDVEAIKDILSEMADLGWGICWWRWTDRKRISGINLITTFLNYMVINEICFK